MKVVVIGGGQASFSFIQSLNSLMADAEIVLLSEEDEYPYQRPPLSKKYLQGSFAKERLLFRDAGWYEKQGVEVRLGVRAESLDAVAKEVIISGGERMGYDKLFLGTGGKVRELPSEVMNGVRRGVHSVRSVSDVDRLRTDLQICEEILIVGGGYIGLEVASILSQQGKRVSIIEVGERILRRVACEETSNFLQNLHEHHGVTFYEGVGVSKLWSETSGKFTGLELTDGSSLAGDLLLVAIGIEARNELGVSGGLLSDGDILVDSHCRTIAKDIYGGGDSVRMMYKDVRVCFESVYQAKSQGEVAARVIAGEDISYAPFPWFWSDQYDVKLQTAGLALDYDDVIVRAGKKENSYSHWYCKGNEVVAVDTINDTKSFHVGKQLLEKSQKLCKSTVADFSLAMELWE